MNSRQPRKMNHVVCAKGELQAANNHGLFDAASNNSNYRGKSHTTYVRYVESCQVHTGRVSPSFTKASLLPIGMQTVGFMMFSWNSYNGVDLQEIHLASGNCSRAFTHRTLRSAPDSYIVVERAPGTVPWANTGWCAATVADNSTQLRPPLLQ